LKIILLLLFKSVNFVKTGHVYSSTIIIHL